MRLRPPGSGAIGLVLLALSGVPVRCGAQEQMLPPGPGWASAGPAGLVLDRTPASLDPLAAPHAPVWMAHSRPFHIAGLAHTFLEVSRTGSRTFGALTLSQVTGDGMTTTALGLEAYRGIAVTRRARSTGGAGRLVLGLGWGVHRLGGGGFRTVTASRLRFRIAFEQGPLRAAAWSDAPMAGWLRKRVVWALGWTTRGWSAAVGTCLEENAGITRACVVQGRLGAHLLTVGLWGDPPAPSAGLVFRLPGCAIGAELRHLPGPGTHVLWSLSLPSGGAS